MRQDNLIPHPRGGSKASFGTGRFESPKVVNKASAGREPDEWLDLKAVSEYLHVSRSTLYTMVREEVLPVVRVGRSIRVSRKQLISLLESGELGL